MLRDEFNSLTKEISRGADMDQEELVEVMSYWLKQEVSGNG